MRFLPHAMPCLAAAILASLAPAQDLLVRRGVTQPSGTVLGVGPQGVTVGSDVSHQLLPWDAIATVPADWAERAAPYAAAADSAWRARTRLERGDLPGAEALLERLSPSYEGTKGPTSELVFGGLLICRLARGAQASAVAPLLEYLSVLNEVEPRPLIRGGFVPDPADLSAIDSVTGLAPMLPPIWLSGPGVVSLARGLWPTFPGRTGVLAVLYEQSARAEAQLPVTLPPRPTADDSAELVWDIVVARAGDPSQRIAARDSLRARLEKAPAPWTEAWIRTALGRSLLIETEEELQLLGIAEIAVVPAALERVCPYLTGIALAEMALGAIRQNDVKAAIALRARLAERFPGHPALDWEPLRHWSFPDSRPAPEPAAAGDPPP